MAEVHGCGEEARSSARRQVAREGTVNPGSGDSFRIYFLLTTFQVAIIIDPWTLPKEHNLPENLTKRWQLLFFSFSFKRITGE